MGQWFRLNLYVEDIPLCAKYILENLQAMRKIEIIWTVFCLKLCRFPNIRMEMIIRSFVWFSETQIFRFECEDFRKSFPLRDWIEINSIGDVLWSSQSYHNVHISNNLSYDGFCNVLRLQRRWCVSRCRIWFWTSFIFGVCIAKFKANNIFVWLLYMCMSLSVLGFCLSIESAA